MQDRILHRHMWTKLHKLCGHDTACRVIRIFQDIVDHLTFLSVSGHQNTFDNVGGHLFYKVRRVIHIELIYDFLQLAVGKSADQHLLCIRFHLNKSIRSQLLGKKPVE